MHIFKMLKFVRCFHLSIGTKTALTSPLFKSDAMKQAGFMNKIMKKHGNGNKSKRGEFGLLPLGILPKTTVSLNPTRLNYRRAGSLNKIFMEYITDFMSSRFLCENTGDLLAEVNRVEISPDFQYVNVFYINRTETDSEELQKTLNGVAGIIRHEMSQLKVIGHIPKINFVLDQQYLKMMEVETLLKHADLGPVTSEDFVDEESPESALDDIDIPVSDRVYGLNHPLITEKIKQRKRLAKKPKEVREESVDSTNSRTNDLTSSSSEIRQFLKRRDKI